MRYQLRQLRNHPSVFVFLYGSDNPPPPDTEQMYLQVMAEENWPNPYLNLSGGPHHTRRRPELGVKKGPGPTTGYRRITGLPTRSEAAAWGFITETSPGPAGPGVAQPPADDGSLEHLWPIGDSVWNFHAGDGGFAQTTDFNTSLEKRYGPAAGTNDYAMKSQMMTYEAERHAMFGSLRPQQVHSTRRHPMVNEATAWPGLIWHLYDYYLQPAGGYFGTA